MDRLVELNNQTMTRTESCLKDKQQYLLAWPMT